MSDASRDMTPTDELIMEVLAARHRLGEHLWTFDSKHKQRLERLANNGYVNLMHGIVEKTVRASLTEKGKMEYVSADYQPPLIRRLEEAMNSNPEGEPESWYRGARHIRSRVRSVLDGE